MVSLDILGTPHAYRLSEARPNQPVFVFLHGWLLSHHYWQPLVEQLSPDFQCLTYDMSGFGESQPISNNDPDRDYSPRYYARELQILLTELQIDRAWLVGHSLGGTIALWTARQCPERVCGVTCVNAGGGIYLADEFDRFRSAGSKMLQWRPGWLQYVFGLDLLFARANVASAIDRSWGHQRVKDFLSADETAARGTLLDSTTEEEVHKLPQVVAELSQPAYFIAGLQDTIMPPKYVHHLASFHPQFQHCGANTIELDGCGHFAMLEQTAQVADHLRAVSDKHAADFD
jgi:pimeloyl-ACP methyl ester carboxylesterase